MTTPMQRRLKVLESTRKPRGWLARKSLPELLAIARKLGIKIPDRLAR